MHKGAQIIVQFSRFLHNNTCMETDEDTVPAPWRAPLMASSLSLAPAFNLRLITVDSNNNHC